MPSAAVINRMLVPPKLSSGNVIPVSGKMPIIDAIFRTTCVPNQPNTPATKSLRRMSTKWSIILSNLINKATNKAKIIIKPTKPNVSPMIAKTESLIASGK